jgi:hypothetical protein
MVLPKPGSCLSDAELFGYGRPILGQMTDCCFQEAYAANVTQCEFARWMSGQENLFSTSYGRM